MIIVMEEDIKRGYLNEDFRLFHIKDRRELAMDYHYHEFDKIVIFISGNVEYAMEGKSYYLKPWDILLVSHACVHKPIIDVSTPYERIVLWMSPDFLASHTVGGDRLTNCFRLAQEREFALIRLSEEKISRIRSLLFSIEAELSDDKFAHELLGRTYLMQFMIELNRLALEDVTQLDTEAYASDPEFQKIITYVNTHLDSRLSIDELSSRFFISKSHLMHRFKAMTGYTAHSYISKKRLIYAADLMRSGVSAVQASREAGFNDYSAFFKAFKQMYGVSPSEFGQ